MPISSEHGITSSEVVPQPVFFEQDGIRYYVEQVRSVKLSDFDKLRVSPESLVHIARHLIKISPEAQKRLIGQSFQDGDQERVIDDSFLDRQLETVGSKFHSDIVDPEKLTDFCIRKIRDLVETGQGPVWTRNLQTGVLSANFQVVVSPEDKKFFGLKEEDKFGDCSLIKINPDIADLVTVEQRGAGQAVDRINVNVVRGIDLPLTDNLVITLRQKDENSPPVFHTAYTGITTPPFPRPSSQSPEELKYNQEWWSKHTFVK